MNTSSWSVVKKMRWVSWEYFINIYLCLFMAILMFLTPEILYRVCGAFWTVSALIGFMTHYRETKARLLKGESKDEKAH